MRNRAKCKLCGDIIESYHSQDYVSCKCDEIAVHGGNAMKCAAKSWDNFFRVDDEGNDIITKVMQKGQETPSDKPSRKELMIILDQFIRTIQDLPPDALYSPINHHDLAASLLLLRSILAAD